MLGEETSWVSDLLLCEGCGREVLGGAVSTSQQEWEK
jgi:hypothetical protein